MATPSSSGAPPVTSSITSASPGTSTTTSTLVTTPSLSQTGLLVALQTILVQVINTTVGSALQNLAPTSVDPGTLSLPNTTSGTWPQSTPVVGSQPLATLHSVNVKICMADMGLRHFTALEL